MTLKAGSAKVFELPFSAHPQPKVNWFFKGKPLAPSDRIKEQTIRNMTSLSMKKIQKADEGEYKITLENEHGQTTLTINVFVIGEFNYCIIV